ncbi:urea carboxylase [Alkalilimnicola ehrlichii]|uniref:urea amidolyase associated protein UAAP1 n=1 Tax=Alkalilimnicola ehrlichii TaxID=351052 RepID=UPI000E2F0D0F|nr:urea amidolyase associated protein UAAP1 [Alkalilimnicola ehrlichii]RFA25522.1 urea carboxylase [Alkalilimnicola ehrlichii]
MTTRECVHSETVPGGRYWSQVIKRGFSLRLTDPSGGANVGMLLFNPHNHLERYNMSDTLKGQHTAKLGRGNMLYSDMGRAMLSIVEDTAGWHDTIGGMSDAALVARKWGRNTYQTARNDFYRNGRELFLIELGKWGLGKRDLVPNLNLFSKVYVDAAGNLTFDPAHAKAGAMIELRAEMDTLVVLNTAQHPLDPSPEYAPRSVQLDILRAAPVAEDDYCRNFRPENERAYQNAAIYNCQG